MTVGTGPEGTPAKTRSTRFSPAASITRPGEPMSHLAPLNLCAATVDGIANHSWSRPAPATPEGEVVSWADRVAYVCHDWEDAVLAGIVAPHQLPSDVREICGERRSTQLGSFIRGLVSATLRTGQVGMEEDTAGALAAFRACNYERIYLREASVRQGHAVVHVLRALVEHFSDRPHLIADNGSPARRRPLGGQRGGDPRRRDLRGRHDGSFCLPPGGRPPRLGRRQTPGRRRLLIGTRLSAN